MKGIILAGGQGSRLRPLTCNMPKPMVPLMGKPVMQYAIELLKNNGVTEIGVTVQYLAEEIINYFGDGSSLGVSLKYFVEDNPVGTAGSVKNAEEFLDETFFVVSGDAITDVDLRSALKFHRRKKGIGTLVLKEEEVPLEYGVVVTDETGRITGFLEKPSWSEVFSDKVNTGIYILEPAIFQFYEKGEKFDFSNDLFPIIMGNDIPLYGYVSNCYWCDIGSTEQFVKCNYDVLCGSVNLCINAKQVSEGVWIGEHCTISPSAKISAPAYIGSNTEVYEDAEIGAYSVIGENNIINSKASINASVIFDNCYVGKEVELREALICNKVQLQRGVLVAEETAIGEESFIEEGAVIKPRSKIWPNKRVGRSEIVRGNVIMHKRYQQSLFNEAGVSGEVNVDITPEFLSKLASAYAATLSSDSKVAISFSNDNTAKMLKNSVLSGLMSMGIQVYELFNSTIQMTRRATAFYNFQGAIHIYTDKIDNQIAKLAFMDEDGLNISKALRKKVESNFKREDFRRIKAENIKEVKELKDVDMLYKESILNKVDISSIKKRNYKLVLATKNEVVIDIMKYMSKELNIELIVNSESTELGVLAKQVTDKKANLGAWISDDGKQYTFIDEVGVAIKNELEEAMEALILLKTFKFKNIVTSVDSSYAIESLANRFNANFIRTKIEERTIIDEYIKNEEDKDKRSIIEAYLLITDATSMSVLLLDLISKFRTTLSSIVEEIPKYHMKYVEIACPWEFKGKVMRNIIEGCNSLQCVDLIEGVRVQYDDKCWALIVPDACEPICKVYTEAEREEEAEQTLKRLSCNIQKIIK